jgi:hypothetical protein
VEEQHGAPARAELRSAAETRSAAVPPRWAPAGDELRFVAEAYSVLAPRGEAGSADASPSVAGTLAVAEAPTRTLQEHGERFADGAHFDAAAARRSSRAERWAPAVPPGFCLAVLHAGQHVQAADSALSADDCQFRQDLPFAKSGGLVMLWKSRDLQMGGLLPRCTALQLGWLRLLRGL